MSATIPFDECICEGKVARPRRNCWATTHNLKGTMSTTRTFTVEEERMVARALIAYRNTVQPAELAVIDGILRDGWLPTTADTVKSHE